MKYYKLISALLAMHCLLFSNGLQAENHTQKTVGPAQPTKEVIIEGLAHPWSIAFLSESEVLITEKDGTLLKINLQTKQKTAISNLPGDLASRIKVDASKHEKGIYPASLDGVTGSFNMGLFDVVLDPDFQENQKIYISYAAQKGNTFTTKVISAILKQDALHDVEALFVATPFTPGAWHFGGGLTFDREGKLLITVGERLFNEVNQPAMPIAQNLQDKRGKIHRIERDGSVPQNNPRFGEAPITTLYAAGIRAAQGITLHPHTGDIWFSEHGTHQGDEINLLKPRANYGWPVKTTGTYRYKEYEPPALAKRSFTQPVWFWPHTVAPTGLVFYTGEEFPEWKNSLFVSGLSRGSLWRLSIEGEVITALEELFVNQRVRSRKIAQSPEGKLYLLTDEDNGKIIRIRNARQ